MKQANHSSRPRIARGSLVTLAAGAALLVLAGCSSSDKRQDEAPTTGAYGSEQGGESRGSAYGESSGAYGERSATGAASGAAGMGGESDWGGTEGGGEGEGAKATPLADRYPSATARVKGGQGYESLEGIAAFTQTPSGLRVSVQLTNAPPGEHGVHIHENGTCEGNFESAGKHYNPGDRPHGLPTVSEDQRHIGDLGNVTIAPDGKGHLSLILLEPNLKADDEKSFVGRAIIVHAMMDDGVERPPKPGDRIACGVIEQGDSTGSGGGSGAMDESGEENDESGQGSESDRMDRPSDSDRPGSGARPGAGTTTTPAEDEGTERPDEDLPE